MHQHLAVAAANPELWLQPSHIRGCNQRGWSSSLLLQHVQAVSALQGSACRVAWAADILPNNSFYIKIDTWNHQLSSGQKLMRVMGAGSCGWQTWRTSCRMQSAWLLQKTVERMRMRRASWVQVSCCTCRCNLASIGPRFTQYGWCTHAEHCSLLLVRPLDVEQLHIQCLRFPWDGHDSLWLCQPPVHCLLRSPQHELCCCIAC